MTFGSELQRYRQAAGLSLAELSQRTHYSKGYLSKDQEWPGPRWHRAGPAV
jgi:hypothetical protein